MSDNDVAEGWNISKCWSLVTYTCVYANTDSLTTIYHPKTVERNLVSIFSPS